MSKSIDRAALKVRQRNETQIKKAGYDKTLVGFVSEKVENDDGSYYWIVQVEGAAYKIKPENCNIADVGQAVKLYIPNHDYKNKYAEVIINYTVIQPIPGVPVLKIESRYMPMRLPVEMSCNDDKTEFYFYYSGTDNTGKARKGKLTVNIADTSNPTETLEEVDA